MPAPSLKREVCMKKVLSLLTFLEKLIEIYIPAVCFVIMFFVFNMQVVLRYGFNSPTVWSNEVAQITFLLLVMLSSNYSFKIKKHVCFTMLHDAVNDIGKHIIDILASLLLLVLFVYAFPYCWDAIFSNPMKSSVLRLPLKWVYFPYLIFMFFTILYSLLDIIKSANWLVKNRKGEGLEE